MWGNTRIMLGFDGDGKRVRLITSGTVHRFDPFAGYDAFVGHTYRLERVDNRLKLVVDGVEWCCADLNNLYGPAPFVVTLNTNSDDQSSNLIELDFVRIE